MSCTGLRKQTILVDDSKIELNCESSLKMLDLYYNLVEEEEERAVSSFLRELMERDVLDDATKRKMEHDDDQIKRQLRDPVATMEARHQQVRLSNFPPLAYEV